MRFERSLRFAVFLIASYSFACLSFFLEPSNLGSKMESTFFPFFFVPPGEPASSPAGALAPSVPPVPELAAAPSGSTDASAVMASRFSGSFSGFGFHFLFHRWKQSQGDRRSIASVRRTVLNESEINCQLNGNWWHNRWSTTSSSFCQIVAASRVS